MTEGRFVCLMMLAATMLLSSCAHNRPGQRRDTGTDPKATPPTLQLTQQIVETQLLSYSKSRAAGDSWYAETTGTVVRIPLGTGTPIGQGFSSVGNNVRGIAVKRDTLITPAPENSVVYKFEYIRDYEDLAKALDVSVSASYSGVGGGASAKVNLFKSAKLSSTKAYALISMTVLTHTETLKSLEFDEAALRRGGKADLTEFLSTYGDTFIFRLMKGAELHAVLEFDMSRKELQERLIASAKGNYGGFSAKGSIDESLKKLIEKTNVKVRYAQSGAGTGRPAHPPPLAPEFENKETEDNNGTVTKLDRRNVATTGGVLLLNINDFMGRVRDFAEEARKLSLNSAVLAGEAVDYNVITNKPASFVVHPKLTASRTLEDLALVRAKLNEELESNSEILQFPERFKGTVPKEIQARVDFMTFAEKYVGRLGEELIAYPRLADQGRDKLSLPKLSGYRTKGSTCEIPTNGDVELSMLCMFDLTAGSWRLVPDRAAIRVLRTYDITLDPNAAPYLTHKFPLKERGEWITGEPTRKVWGVVRNTGEQIERFSVVASNVDGESGILTLRTNVWQWRYAGPRRQWPILWLACPDDCNENDLLMEDIPKVAGAVDTAANRPVNLQLQAAPANPTVAARASGLIPKDEMENLRKSDRAVRPR